MSDDTPSRQTSFKVRADLTEALDARARQDGSLAKVLNDALEAYLTAPSTPLMSPPAIDTLDAAAQVFLAHIPPPMAEQILDMCADNGRKPHEYLLSYVNLAHERSETSMLASETSQDAMQIPKVVVNTPGVCAFSGCRKSFILTQRGQMYCPDPDDGTESCGRKAHLEHLHARRPQDPRAANQLAPTQQDTVGRQDMASRHRAALLKR